MKLVGQYAYAGATPSSTRCSRVLGTESTHEADNYHNFAWREEHFGRHLPGDP